MKKLNKMSPAEMAIKGKAVAANASSMEERIRAAGQLLRVQPTGFSPAEDVVRAADDTSDRSATLSDGRKIYFERVHVDQVDPNPFNARQIYKPEKINELAASIAASSQLVPCIGTKRNGRVIIVGGHYRSKAIKKAGIAHIDFMIHEDITDEELYELSYKENEERASQSPIDNALAWRNLIDKQLYADETAIAEATGISAPNVNKTMAILKLSEPILDLVKETPESFALTALYELYLLEKAAGMDVALGMAIKIGEGNAGRKECADLRARIELPKKDRKQKEISRQYKIQLPDGQSSGTLKDWDSGKVTLDIVIPDPKERLKLIEELKLRFNLND